MISYADDLQVAFAVPKEETLTSVLIESLLGSVLCKAPPAAATTTHIPHKRLHR